MTESYEKWESEIDWSKRTSVVGGPIFYDFVKAKAIPALEDGLRQLETAKASCEDRIRRWGCIAERAGKLSDCFALLTECEDFMTLIHDFDEKTAAIFSGERIWTLSDWLRLGKRLDNDYRLRCAPECFRTRVFRDLARDFGNIVESAAKVNFERMPDFLHGIGDGLKVIIEVANRMQGICRRAKKDMKRHGSRFWAKLDEWNTMRNAV